MRGRVKASPKPLVSIPFLLVTNTVIPLFVFNYVALSRLGDDGTKIAMHTRNKRYSNLLRI